MPESEGGNSEEDNGIAICITCHIDVHSKVPFTRRFTVNELKQHRDNVFQLVADGKLIEGTESNEAICISEDKSDFQFNEISLTKESVEILVNSAQSESGIRILKHMAGTELSAGRFKKDIGRGREYALYERSVRELENNGFIQQVNYEHGGYWTLEYDGYLAADVLTAQANT